VIPSGYIVKEANKLRTQSCGVLLIKHEELSIFSPM
jgi:hypothetical protein